jgi:hypothetical protein
LPRACSIVLNAVHIFLSLACTPLINAALAIAAVNKLQSVFSVNQNQHAQGIEKTKLSARFNAPQCLAYWAIALGGFESPRMQGIFLRIMPDFSKPIFSRVLPK